VKLELAYKFRIERSSKKLGLIFSFLFFCLDAKEPKSQDVAKLLPHKPDAGPLARWQIGPPRRTQHGFCQSIGFYFCRGFGC
jgi:hypothetical protein